MQFKNTILPLAFLAGVLTSCGPTKEPAAPSAPAPASEAKKEEPKPVVGAVVPQEPVKPVTNGVGNKLLVGTFLYREPNEKSTKSWWYGAGTDVTTNPSEGEWVAVTTGDGKRGFVKKTSLVAK